MVVTYYIKLFRPGADKQNGILMSLLFLVAETITHGLESLSAENEANTQKNELHWLWMQKDVNIPNIP